MKETIFAQETYIFQEPNHHSHPIRLIHIHVIKVPTRRVSAFRMNGTHQTKGCTRDRKPAYKKLYAASHHGVNIVKWLSVDWWVSSVQVIFRKRAPYFCGKWLSFDWWVSVHWVNVDSVWVSTLSQHWLNLYCIDNAKYACETARLTLSQRKSKGPYKRDDILQKRPIIWQCGIHLESSQHWWVSVHWVNVDSVWVSTLSQHCLNLYCIANVK